MRKLILATLAAAAVAYGGTAFAQSHQGGSLGINPGGNQMATTNVPPPPDIGSRQGGYLGQNPGANLKPAQAPTGDMRGSPTAWCMGSTDPFRCRSKAAVEHEYCMTKEERYYAGCRAALHQMFFK